MKKILIFAVILLAGFGLASYFGLTDLLTNFQQLRHYLESFGWWGYGVFILLSIVVAVFMLPGQLLAIVGGIIYGGVVGGALTVIGASVGATISFIIGKYVARDYVVKKFQHNEVFKKIEHGVAENGVSFLIFTRLVPIFPYAIQSYAYALTPMTVRKFSVISFLTMLPASFIYAFMASEIVRRGVSWTLLVELSLAGLLLALLSFLPKKISKKLQRLAKENGK